MLEVQLENSLVLSDSTGAALLLDQSEQRQELPKFGRGDGTVWECSP